jgi:hypothetical protein
LSSQDVLYINPSKTAIKAKATTWESKPSTWEAKSSSRKAETSMLMSTLLIVLRTITSSLVVDFSFLGVFQKLISIDYLFKLLFGSGINFVSVGVVFSRSSFKCCFDLFIAGVLFNAKNFVRIWYFFGYGHVESQNKEKYDQVDSYLFHLTCKLSI